MKAIIFGINGQDGFYLSAILKNNNIEVVGVSRSNPAYILGNIGDYQFVENLIKGDQPEYIFHLAANSTTGHDVLFENHQTIVTGSLNILEATYKHSKHSKIFISGSGLQFINNNSPIAETTQFEARDSYSMARIQSIYSARYYRTLCLKVYVGYFFNHDSPLRSEKHVNQKIALAAQNIAADNTIKLPLGDVYVKKEFNYAGDIAQAIWLFVNNDQVFETTIGSGKAYAIADWLDLCFNYYKLQWQNHIKLIPGFIPEYKILVSNPATIYSLGWRPTVDIAQLALMMLEANKK